MLRRSLSMAGILLVAGCGGGGSPVKAPAAAAPESIHLTSPAFRDGGTIPTRFTCSGKGSPPPLHWSGVPSSARSLALLVDDPDAPSGTFVHWTAWDIAPRSHRLAKPPREGNNSSGDTGWTPPCPPNGAKAHHYVFTLYALSKPLGLESGTDADAVHRAVRARALARGRLTGRFAR
jgi:Raf kinase inhibitor-like YbhB/YbcL family protein